VAGQVSWLRGQDCWLVAGLDLHILLAPWALHLFLFFSLLLHVSSPACFPLLTDVTKLSFYELFNPDRKILFL
jgi:hypothetical protein